MSEPTHSTLNLFRHQQGSQAVAAGDTIFRAGDEGGLMYVIQEGEADIMVQDRIVETVGPGGVVGEMSLVDRRPRSATVIARTDCKVLPVDERRFQFLIQQAPYFAIEIMRIMASRLRAMDASGGR